jgi:MFS transporter, DHA1 family, tetracycline resistance protein
MDSFDVTSTNVSLFMSLMGIGPCLSFAVAMPLLRRRYSTRAIASWSLLATALLIVASAFAPTMMLEWCLVRPISITLATSYAALVILFTDRTTQDTKGEIFGVTAAIKAFALGIIAFTGAACKP